MCTMLVKIGKAKNRSKFRSQQALRNLLLHIGEHHGSYGLGNFGKLFPSLGDKFK